MAASVEKPHVSVEELTALGEDVGISDEDNSEVGQGSEGDGAEDEGSDGERAEDEGSEGGEEEDPRGSDGEEAENEGGEEQSGDGTSEAQEEGNPNAGWAEAMAKILQKKTPGSKSSILLKNKQLDKIKEKEKKELLEKRKQVDKKRAWEMMCHEKPDVVRDRENERDMQRIATRGVVQLFNAVRTHQKNVDVKVKEAGGSERKKAKILSSVSKKDFINVLRGTEAGGGSATAAGADEKPAWSALKDDFMMGASMKDWDKDSDEEQGGGEDYNSESD